MIVLIRGGGDLASGVAVRLYRAGLKIIITELPEPLAVRRSVAFSEAVYNGETLVEGITAKFVKDPSDVLKMMNVWAKGMIPVIVDPDAQAISLAHPSVVVDARLLKQRVPLLYERVALLIGLGPGFIPQVNCHAVVETARGPALGRVYWNSSPLSDTGIPDLVLSQGKSRVLRAPQSGKLKTKAQIGDIVEEGEIIATVGDQNIVATFRGVVRGLLPDGYSVLNDLKIGDLDPRCDPTLCKMVSDKALAIGGGVLEAILSRPELRKIFWS